MPTLEVPVWMQNDTYAASQDRTLTDNLWGADGIINVGDMAVSQRAAGTNMSVDVASGVGIVTGDDTTAQGKYVIRHLSGPTNVTLTTAPGVGLSRIDLIVARIRDAAVIGGANNDFIFDKVTGTAASTGSQVAPSLPNSCMLLAQVLVGPNVSTIVNANITDMRRRAWNLSGGTAICTSTTRPTAPWAGLTAFETDTGRLVAYTGTAWVPLSSIGYAHAKAYRAGAWNTVTGNAEVFMAFDTTDFDASTNLGSGRFTAARAGYLHCSGRLAVTSTGANQFFQAFVYKNLVKVGSGTTGLSTVTGQIIDSVWAVTVSMAAADQINIWCVSGGNVGLAGSTGLQNCYGCFDQVG